MKLIKQVSIAMVAAAFCFAVTGCGENKKILNAVKNFQSSLIESGSISAEVTVAVVSDEVISPAVMQSFIKASEVQNKLAKEMAEKDPKKSVEYFSSANFESKWHEAYKGYLNLLNKIPGVHLVDRSKIEQVLKEHKFQLTDWSNDKKTAEIGKALNADCVLEVDSVLNNADYNFLNFYGEGRFTNVNTLESVEIGYWDIVSMVDQKKSFPYEKLSNFLTNMEFDSFVCVPEQKYENIIYGLTKTQIISDEPSEVYYCPFRNEKIVESVPFDNLKDFESIQSLSFVPDEKMCYAIMDSGDYKELKLSYSIINPLIIRFEYEKRKFPFNFKTEKSENASVVTKTVRFNDCAYAKIKLNGNGIKLNTKMYRNNNEFAIELGTNKEKGQIMHYFAIFTKE